MCKRAATMFGISGLLVEDKETVKKRFAASLFRVASGELCGKHAMHKEAPLYGGLLIGL